MIHELVDVPRNAGEVRQLLGQLGFPNQFPSGILRVIAEKEGKRFALALAAIANQEDSDGLQRDYVDAICAAVSPQTSRVCESLGFSQVSLVELMDISLAEGRAFRAAVSNAANSAPTDESGARAYLEGVLGMAVGAACWELPMQQAVHQIPHPPEFTESHSNHTPTTKPVASLPENQSLPQTTREETPTTEFESCHVYGGTAAFCFSMDRTRSGNNPTIRIEAAQMIRKGMYDWSGKVGFQLRVAELPLVYGVMTGRLSDLELTGHGNANEKALVIQDQRTKLFMSMRCKNRTPMAIPVPAAEMFRPMAMLWRQLQANTPNVDANALDRMVQAVCERHARNS